MKYLYFIILLCSMNISCRKSLKRDPTGSFCNFSHDKIHFDIDTVKIKEIAQKSSKPILLIFSSFTMADTDLLSFKMTKNSAICERLENTVIVQLNIDNKTIRDQESLTIGYMNLSLLRNKFGFSSQPIHFFIDQHMNRISDILTYSKDDEEIIRFLDNGRQAMGNAPNELVK